MTMTEIKATIREKVAAILMKIFKSAMQVSLLEMAIILWRLFL